jgi:hypothetical protein
MSETVQTAKTTELGMMLEIRRGPETFQVATEPLPDFSDYNRELLLRALPKHIGDHVRTREIEQAQPGFREEAYYEDSPYPDTEAMHIQRAIAASAFTALIACRSALED